MIDVDIDFTLAANFTPQAFTGFTTVVLGTFYYLALDGRASNKLVPVGLPTTT